MQVSPRVRRTAIAAGVGVGTVGLLAGVFMLGPLAASVLILVAFVLVWPLAAVIQHIADDIPYQSPDPGRLLRGRRGALPPRRGQAAQLGSGRSRARADRGDRVRAGRPGLAGQAPASAGAANRSTGGLIALTQEEQVEDEKLIASLQCPLSIEELCGVWGETAMTLAEGAGPRDRQAVAEVRRICLDEFERRNPDGFHRWIEAGAPANPSVYLLPKAD